MAAIPGDVDTERQPPMTVPLRHFLVGLGFLLAGVMLGVGLVAGVVPGLGTLAHVHVLLVGWICVTIMGAMTQFVPVWSGTELHSQRLASAQLVLVAGGLLGFALSFLLGAWLWLVVFGTLMFAGFWTFAYNLGRTLLALDSLDVTERHFLLAVGCFVLVTALGLLLAHDFLVPTTAILGASHASVLGAHATLAVFGIVLTTVYGALYQLATMFTQTDLHGVDLPLQRVEELAHPIGVGALAVGRLLDWQTLARAGGVLVLVAAVAVSVVLARRLWEMRVAWTPMHRRYAVVAPALAGWALLTLPAWLAAPTARTHLLGAPGAIHLLVLGAIGFVVTGTLYHVVPFVVWVHRYSDLLGFEDVPMIDDLYDDRLAATDGACFLAGTALLFTVEWGALPAVVAALGGVLVSLGAVAFALNLLLVVHRHSPYPLARVVLGSFTPWRRHADGETTPQEQRS